MIIGFDVSQTGRWKAGGGFFADGLIRGLAEVDGDNQYLLYPTFGDGVWDPAWPRASPPVHARNFRRGPGHRERDELENFWRSDPIDEAWLGQPRIMHSNNFFCPRSRLGARVVYTLYDLGFLEHPEWTTEENRLTCFDGVFNASLFADHIVAISDYSRQHFLRTFPHYPADRISVVYPASRFGDPSDPPYTGVRGLQKDAFWLSVATLEPRKNHQRLLLAYAQLKAQSAEVLPLVLAGARGWLMDQFERELDELGLRNDVILLGYVEDAKLQWLYTNCFGFIYVSLFEGFGMPPLEAMSCGAPVITSNTTSLPEVVGDAAIQVDPYQPAAIRGAMRTLMGGDIDRAGLRERSFERARRFSWRTSARHVRALYETLGSEGQDISMGPSAKSFSS